MNQNVQKTIEDIQLQYTDGVVDVPVVLVVQIPQVQVVTETVEIPRLRIVEKIDETPEFDGGTGKKLISQLQREALDADTGKHSSTLETAVSRSIEADPESANEGHPDKICDHFSDVVLDACLTCDTRCKVARDTCMKDNMFMVAGEITVVVKLLHETVLRGVAQNIGIDSIIDDSN